MHCPTHAYADVVVAAATGRIDFAGAQALATYDRTAERP